MKRKITMVWITMLLIMILTMVGGEAKPDEECQRECHEHCLGTSIVAECLKCLGQCGKTPSVVVRTMDFNEHT
ncbi:hypothetical protein EUTSA_v10009843mg [Eutrema salsugineum]|uniref:Uncharacterized protein n=1 Tax=Eutrema salsugineum TaxID=72664 RepID=V4KAF7_EUTSA